MANNRIRWDGLEELRKELRNLPADLAAEAEGIVLDEAEGAQRDVAANYAKHRRSGRLAAGLQLMRSAAGRFGVGAVLINRNPLAWIFENGSQARHTSIGANRGSMPAAHAFIPPVIRHRRSMYRRLADMLERHGLRVTGRAA